MAHFVGKELHIRPNDILDGWGVSELIVAFGEYSNEITKKNFEEWKQMPSESRVKIPKPKDHHVTFIGVSELEE